MNVLNNSINLTLFTTHYTALRARNDVNGCFKVLWACEKFARVIDDPWAHYSSH